MSPNEQVGVGIIGGGMGAYHARNYTKQPTARLLAIAGPDVDRCERVAKETGIPSVYADYHEMLARPDIEAVTVAVPNMLHRTIVQDCLAAGKHVMVEKPLANSLEEGRAIVEAASKTDRVVMIGFNNRFSGASQVLKRQITAGTLGDLYYAKARWLRRQGIPGFGGWFTTKSKSGGGPLIDLGVHMLDLALFLLGYPQVSSVYGSTYAAFGPRGRGAMPGWQVSDAGPAQTYDVEDLATGMVKFANGATLLIEASWATYIAESDDIHVQLFGTEGGATLGFDNSPGARPLSLYSEMNGDQVDMTPHVPPINGHVEELRLFLNAIREGGPTPARVEDGLVILQIIDALYRSAASGASVTIS